MLKIDQFTAEYHIPKQAINAIELKQNLDRLVQGTLAHALSARLHRHDVLRDDSIWMIRSLHAEIDIDARGDPERISERWADAIAREFERAMAATNCSEDVIHFTSSAALIARYIREQATGTASGKWYFQRFDGLAVLQPSAAIRTVLTADVAAGIAAASEPSSQEWMTIASALTESDASYILRAWGSGVDDASALPRLWRLWKNGSFSTSSRGYEARTALRLAAAALRDGQDSVPANSARALTRFAHLCRALSTRMTERLIEWAAAGNIPLLYKTFGVDEAEPLGALAGAPSSLLKEVAQAVRSVPTDRGMTRFGGIFLLLPLLAEMPFDAMARGEAAWMRFFTALKCFGRDRAQEFFADPMMPYLLGVSAPVSSDRVAKFFKWCARHTGRIASVLDEWLRQQGCLTGETVSIGVPARRIHATADLGRGIWVALGKRVPCMDQPRSDPTEVQRKRLEMIGSELDYLDFPASIPANTRTNLLFSRIANVLLRNFSWRLPGFHGSTIPYLAANFYDMHANLEREEGTLKVSLGRPPLHVVLNISGMMNREFQLPWMERCTIAVTTEVA